ncbi:replicative DNA helicase [Helicobacter suis]|uniref:replicative DNA helicase n=1 Tax=Helicobacter suis TaxID=104628 RepID=UPI0013D531EF|nr:replicative DNA helicase [Helicobacter suis]
MQDVTSLDSDLLSMERVVLSALLENQHYEEFARELKPSDFYYEAHQILFELCSELHEEKRPVDAHFLNKKVEIRGDEKTTEALAAIMGTTPLANLGAYIHAIKEAACRRNLLHLARQIHTECDQAKSSQIIIDGIERDLYALSLQTTQGGFKDVKSVLKQTLNLIKEAKLKGNQRVTGVDTGFNKLNDYTGGFQPGDLIVIGARPSMGKTSLVLNIAKTTLNHNQGVAIFSMEMGAEQLMMRLLSNLTSLHLHNLKIGNLSDEDWENLSRSAQNIYHKFLFIDDTSMLTIQHVRSKLRQLKRKCPEITLAIIDYLQLMASDQSLNRHEQIATISRGLKTLARELQTPIIALAQLNRSLESREDRRPILSDLKDSGAIEQDADQVLFLYRDAVYKQRDHNDRLAKLRKEGKSEEAKKLEQQFNAEKKANYERTKGIEQAELILAKNRNGDIGTVKILFNKAYTRFEDPIESQDGEYKPTTFYQETPQVPVPDVF